MAVKTLYKTINTNGEYSCGDIGVTTEEWLDLLNDEKSKPYHEVLLCFLRQKEHKATCVKVSQVYGKPAQYYNSKVYNFFTGALRCKKVGTQSKGSNGSCVMSL